MKKKLIIVLILAELILFDTSGARINANPSNDNGSLAITPGIGYGVCMSTFAVKLPFLVTGLRENAFTIVQATASVYPPDNRRVRSLNAASVRWDSGRLWRKNLVGQELSLKTSDIFIAGSPSPRVITPNGDHVNDYIFFFFEATDAPTDGKIYDLNSAFVANMKPLPGKEDISLVWDGKDDSGQVVAMGVYLYKVTIGDESATGTIVVAR